MIVPSLACNLLSLSALGTTAATQLRNIESRTGKTMAQSIELVRGRGLAKHSEIAAMLKAELGLNIKALPDSPRLEKLPAGQMCNYRVKLTEPGQVDAECVAWMKAAFDAAG